MAGRRGRGARNLLVLRQETDDVDIRNSGVARRVRWKQLMRENAGKIDVAVAEAMEADCYDTCLGRVNPGGHSLAGHFELEAPTGGKDHPFDPSGTFDAKVVDTAMATRMAFAARWGSADGTAFDAAAFLREHPQYDWQEGILRSRPAEPWVEFQAGEK